MWHPARRRGCSSTPDTMMCGATTRPTQAAASSSARGTAICRTTSRSGARVWGLASHLYALRHKGDDGIGDLETLRRFAEVTAAIGGRYAGLNPLHHLFPTDRSRASPYQPSDRRFIDPIYINIGATAGRASICPRPRHWQTTAAPAFAASRGAVAMSTMPLSGRPRAPFLKPLSPSSAAMPIFDAFVAGRWR